MDALTEAGLVALIANHPTPWRAAEVTRAEYHDEIDRTDDPDAYRDIEWTGIVDVNGVRIGAFGFHPHSLEPMGPQDEYVALAALVNGVAESFLHRGALAEGGGDVGAGGSDDPIPPQDLPPFADGPAVLVSVKPEPVAEERAQAHRELTGFTPEGARPEVPDEEDEP